MKSTTEKFRGIGEGVTDNPDPDWKVREESES